MYEHNALGYWSGLALCLTKVRSSRARCPATALIFPVSVCRCCAGIVMDNTQQRRDQMEENADHELRDLQRLMVNFCPSVCLLLAILNVCLCSFIHLNKISVKEFSILASCIAIWKKYLNLHSKLHSLAYYVDNLRYLLSVSLLIYVYAKYWPHSYVEFS